MPSGPEHYVMAEQLMELAESHFDDGSAISAERCLRQAALHIELAKVAVQALQNPHSMTYVESEAWSTAAGSPELDESDEPSIADCIH